MAKFPHDTTGVKEQESFPVLPEGPYQLACKMVKMKKTKETKKPMASIGFQVVNHPNEDFNGTYVWHNVTFVGPKEKGAGMAKHFLKAMGCDFEGQVEVDTDDWKDQVIDVTLKITTWNGKDKNEIDEIIINDSDNEEEEL